MTRYQLVLLALALINSLSFIWAAHHFFTVPEGSDQANPTNLFSPIFIFAHLGLLVLKFRFNALAMSIGILFYLAALLLFWWAIQTNKTQPLSGAFSNDAPQHIAMVGPYRYIRHPIYLSYLLFGLAGAIAIINPLLLLLTAIMLVLLWYAAKQEEAKFATSAFADTYLAYKNRVGMFLPIQLIKALIK